IVSYHSSISLVIEGFTRCNALAKSVLLTIFDLVRIALTAASLHKATRSAPLNPFVDLEISSKFTSFARGIDEVSIFIISYRALSSGDPIYIIRSSLPGRSKDVSIRSGLLVIPITITPAVPESSISVKICESTRSLPATSSAPPLGLARESNSSNTITHGEEAFAFLNISRIAFSDSPTHFDKTSGPRTTIILALLSVARDFAIKVLPQPGGPNNKAPLGGLIPIL